MKAKLVKIRAARRSISAQISAPEPRVKSIKARLAETQSALENLTDELPGTEAKLRTEMSVVEESFRATKTRVERLERKPATEIEKRQQLLAKRRKTSKTACRQLAEGENSFRVSDLRSSL